MLKWIGWKRRIKPNRTEPQFTYYFCSHLIELIPTYACDVSHFKQIDLSFRYSGFRIGFKILRHCFFFFAYCTVVLWLFGKKLHWREILRWVLKLSLRFGLKLILSHRNYYTCFRFIVRCIDNRMQRTGILY